MFRQGCPWMAEPAMSNLLLTIAEGEFREPRTDHSALTCRRSMRPTIAAKV